MSTMYRVFDWNCDSGDEYFKYLRHARKSFHKKVKENPEGKWRLYKDKETKRGSFIEECIMANNKEE